MDMFELKKDIEHRIYNKNTLLITIPEETDIEFVRVNITKFIKIFGQLIKRNKIPVSVLLKNDFFSAEITICDPEKLIDPDYMEYFVIKSTESNNIAAIWEIQIT